MSKSPYPLGGNCPTGAVPEYPSALVLIVGNVPCHTLACFGAIASLPHVPGAGLATSSGRFPFVFGGESFARPLGVGGRVVPRHVDHRMVHAVLNGTLWAFGVTPTRAGDPAPPIGEGGDGGAFGWGGEDHCRATTVLRGAWGCRGQLGFERIESMGCSAVVV